MNTKDKKYAKLSSIGVLLAVSLPFISMLLGEEMSDEIMLGVFGLALGWLGATLLLKFLILREEAAVAKMESRKALNEI